MHLFAGFNKKLAVFDLTRPGHGCREVTTKKRREDGLPGVLELPSLHPAAEMVDLAKTHLGMSQGMEHVLTTSLAPTHMLNWHVLHAAASQEGQRCSPKRALLQCRHRVLHGQLPRRLGTAGGRGL